MKYPKWLVAVALVLLVGCAKELSDDKKKYIGLWKNNETSILITASGRLEYESNAGGAKKTISAPISDFTNEKITAGILFLTTDFTIDRQPKEENGIWSMVIDGKELFKADELGRLPQALAVPKLGKLQELVAADLRLLSKGIKANDFSEFIDHASLIFQSQFSNEKMKEAYAKLVENKLDVESFVVGDFILTSEPTISPEGVLTIQGKYPTTPVWLKFEAQYIYAHPNWKNLGIELKIGRDEA